MNAKKMGRVAQAGDPRKGRRNVEARGKKYSLHVPKECHFGH